MTKKVAGVYLNIHTKYEVSIIMYVDRRANKKVPK